MFSTYRLPGKLAGEKVVKIVRRDRFILFKKILQAGMMIILPSAVFYAMTVIYPALLSGEISFPLAVLGGSAYFLFIWLFFFFSFVDYYLDVWIITSERIIDVGQGGFFSRKVSELSLGKIQDVSSETRGLLPTILKYGNVEVQSAGEEGKFIFQEIPNPEEVRNTIIKLSQGKQRKNML
ncbi:PH domain-containing protein [Candidatus Falkowbacteria bacterium]|nr:PH domain-containing protein [Candidatus Falkowbacteria bacterium]